MAHSRDRASLQAGIADAFREWERAQTELRREGAELQLEMAAFTRCETSIDTVTETRESSPRSKHETPRGSRRATPLMGAIGLSSPDQWTGYNQSSEETLGKSQWAGYNQSSEGTFEECTDTLQPAFPDGAAYPQFLRGNLLNDVSQATFVSESSLSASPVRNFTASEEPLLASRGPQEVGEVSQSWVSSYVSPWMVGRTKVTYLGRYLVVFDELAPAFAPTSASCSDRLADIAQAVESGAVLRNALEAIQSTDRGQMGSLSYTDGSIHEMISTVFQRLDLLPPSDDLLQLVYMKFDLDGTMALDLHCCMCLADALARALLHGDPNTTRSRSRLICPSPAGSPRRHSSASWLQWKRSSLDDWVEHFPSPPMASTSSFTYLDKVPVRFGELSSSFGQEKANNSGQRSRMAPIVESRSFPRTALRLFHSFDAEKEGALAWNSGKIKDFVKSVFEHYDLDLPTEAQISQLFCKFDTERKMRLGPRECFCLVDALVRAMFYTEERASIIETQVQGTVEEWVSTYTAPALGTTTGITYMGRIPVNFSEVSSSMKPVIQANARHRRRLVDAIESGVFMRKAFQTFNTSDILHSGVLTWSSGEIYEFIVTVFQHNGLTPPTKAQTCPLYALFDVEKRHHLDARECLCLVDALVRAVFVEAPPQDNVVINVGLSLPEVEEWLSHYTPPPVGKTNILAYMDGIIVDLADLSYTMLAAASANAPHTARMVDTVESGALVQMAWQTYKRCDTEKRGFLAWNDGAVREFVKAVFDQHGLACPSETQIDQLYTVFDADSNMRLDARECLCLVDALVRGVFHAKVSGTASKSDARIP